MSEYTNKPL